MVSLACIAETRPKAVGRFTAPSCAGSLHSSRPEELWPIQVSHQAGNTELNALQTAESLLALTVSDLSMGHAPNMPILIQLMALQASLPPFHPYYHISFGNRVVGGNEVGVGLGNFGWFGGDTRSARHGAMSAMTPPEAAPKNICRSQRALIIQSACSVRAIKVSQQPLTLAEFPSLQALWDRSDAQAPSNQGTSQFSAIRHASVHTPPECF
jgi:hypothetical protein